MGIAASLNRDLKGIVDDSDPKFEIGNKNSPGPLDLFLERAYISEIEHKYNFNENSGYYSKLTDFFFQGPIMPLVFMKYFKPQHLNLMVYVDVNNDLMSVIKTNYSTKSPLADIQQKLSKFKLPRMATMFFTMMYNSNTFEIIWIDVKNKIINRYDIRKEPIGISKIRKITIDSILTRELKRIFPGYTYVGNKNNFWDARLTAYKLNHFENEQEFDYGTKYSFYGLNYFPLYSIQRLDGFSHEQFKDFVKENMAENGAVVYESPMRLYQALNQSIYEIARYFWMKLSQGEYDSLNSACHPV